MNTVAPQLVSDAPRAEFTAADIARALSTPENRLHKKTVLRTAKREQWPARHDGYRWLFQPPESIAEIMVAAPSRQGADANGEPPAVRFSDLAHSDAARDTVLLREKAVQLFDSQKHLGIEVALETCSAIMRATHAGFKCSRWSLRMWIDAQRAQGLDGLVEQKRGRVGRKAYANDLSEEQILTATALAAGHGHFAKNKKQTRLNIAHAFRELEANPTIGGDARRWLHAARASKSAYPPSFAKAVREKLSPLGAAYLQVGKKAMKLEGPWTERDYSDGSARHVITADDMTGNCYVWTEWNNERGFILIRPQILATLHVGSLSWLNARVIVNARKSRDGELTGSSTYSTLDAFATLGDTLDQIGIFIGENGHPEMTFLLEGGAWQGKDIIGSRIMPGVEQRFGGLRSIGKGIKIIHTRGPRGKGMIEESFNELQYGADNVRGYCGRDERKDCPEETKKNLAMVRAGHAHARQYFMHISEYRQHIDNVMNNMNHTRNDGKICGGISPLEKFHSLQLRKMDMPDKLKYFYRSAFAIEKVTANGWGVTRQTCGRKERFQYDHALLANRHGERIGGYWDDGDPENSAVLFSLRNGMPHEFICVAPRSQNPSAFGATREELAAESTRKSVKMSLVISQAKAVAPYLQRNFKTVTTQRIAAEIGEKLHVARVENGKRIRTRKTLWDFQGGADVLLGPESLDISADDRRGGDHDVKNATANPQEGPLDGEPQEAGEVRETSTTDLSASALLD